MGDWRESKGYRLRANPPAAGGWGFGVKVLGNFCNFSIKQRIFMHISVKIIMFKK